MQKYISEKEWKKRYGTKKACMWALLNARIDSERKCPNPRCQQPIDHTFKPLEKRKCFLCTDCLHHFFPMADTFLDHSKLDLEDEFDLIYKFISKRTGVSALYLSHDKGIAYPTAYRKVSILRDCMTECNSRNLSTTPFMLVEIDESYVPTGNKGRRKHYKHKRGRGSEKNSSVLCISERNGRRWFKTIPATDAASIIPIIEEMIPKGATIYTDSWKAYNSLIGRGFNHEVVNHSIEFVNGSAATNQCENAFSNLKRMLVGTYFNVKEPQLDRYLNEYAFRFNNRKAYDYGFSEILKCLPPLSHTYGTKHAA